MTSVRPRTSSAFAVLMLAVALAACAKGKEAPADAAKGQEAPSSAGGGAVSPSAGLGGGRMHLEILGGAHAGSFNGDMEAGGCMTGSAGPGSWHLLYGGGDPNDPKSLNSVTLDVPDPKAAGGGATPFALQVFFGSGDNTTGAVVNTLASGRGGLGKGTVKVDDRGQTATVTFDATAADGVRLQGTFDCRSILQFKPT